jgi:hypothetical protein
MLSLSVVDSTYLKGLLLLYGAPAIGITKPRLPSHDWLHSNEMDLLYLLFNILT